ncbi:hypothetical protein DZS_03990 [Dickeya ananatis]
MTWNDGGAPREKLMSLGVEALSDAELLAIFFAHGSRRDTCDGTGAESVSAVWFVVSVDDG